LERVRVQINNLYPQGGLGEDLWLHKDIIAQGLLIYKADLKTLFGVEIGETQRVATLPILLLLIFDPFTLLFLFYSFVIHQGLDPTHLMMANDFTSHKRSMHP